MTKQITSGALSFMDRALNLFGVGSQENFLDDGIVSQVMPIDRIAAYSLAIGRNKGMFTSVLSMTHAAAGDVTINLDVYDPPTRANEMGQVLFADVDLWYLGSTAQVTATTQTVDEVQSTMETVGLLGSADSFVGQNAILLQRWDAPKGNAGAGAFMALDGSGSGVFSQMSRPFLWPRTAQWRVASQTTGAGTSQIDVTSLWVMVRPGLYPSVI